MENTYTHRSASVRLSGYYTAFFAIYGIAIPLWPRWLEAEISLTYVGVVLGVSYWLKLIIVPVTSWIADAVGDRRQVMISLAVLLTILIALMPFFEGWVAFAVLWGLGGAFLSTGIPLSDGLTMRMGHLVGIEFGKVRRWGSFAFMLSALAVGALADHYGDDVIYWAMLVTALGLVVASYLVPAIHTPPMKDKAPLLEPLKLPNFPLFLVTVALLLSTHAALYGFSAIYWKSLGYSNLVITLLWMAGVLAEIGMFSISGRLIDRFGAMPMIVVAGIGGIIRWCLIAYATSLPLILTAQIFHAFTFALLYMSLIAYMSKRVPAAISASAQGLYDSLSMGVFFGILTMSAGLLFDMNPSYSFLAMAGCSAIGTGLAVILLVKVRRFERAETEQTPT
ncbi:MAG: MFS transporter [Sneathiella sp.]|nr:MFS transporter [Sneathiella sp.]